MAPFGSAHADPFFWRGAPEQLRRIRIDPEQVGRTSARPGHCRNMTPRIAFVGAGPTTLYTNLRKGRFAAIASWTDLAGIERVTGGRWLGRRG